MTRALYSLAVEKDLLQVEINPLAMDGEGNLMALDAKIVVDDNALALHPDLSALRDVSQEDPTEAKARDLDLSYVTLDGSIGCMVNGAGLAMATLDVIKLHGGQPANFLDVGGGITRDRVAAAFRLILSEPRVKAILVNIFGGIVRCDLIAEGVIEAARETGASLPIVVRLEGTNAQEGRELLAQSGLALIPAATLDEAAIKAVEVAL
jgi:succinyl-CoA synthetase beta subunit